MDSFHQTTVQWTVLIKELSKMSKLSKNFGETILSEQFSRNIVQKIAFMKKLSKRPSSSRPKVDWLSDCFLRKYYHGNLGSFTNRTIFAGFHKFVRLLHAVGNAETGESRGNLK